MLLGFSILEFILTGLFRPGYVIREFNILGYILRGLVILRLVVRRVVIRLALGFLMPGGSLFLDPLCYGT